MTDKQLCDLLHKGDRTAFDTLYQRYWKRLFMYAYKIFEDQLVCEDIVQEVFIRLWERSRQVKVENLENYLFGATRYQVINAIRNKKHTMPYEDILPYLPVEDSVGLLYEAQETSQIINSSVHALPEKCQEVFLLSRENELSNKEIAHRLSISVRTVEAHIYKALKLIKKNLGENNASWFLLVIFF